MANGTMVGGSSARYCLSVDSSMAVSCILAVVCVNVRGKFLWSGLDGWSARLMTEVGKRRGGICGVVDTAGVNYQGKLSRDLVQPALACVWRELLRATEVTCIDAAFAFSLICNTIV